MKRNFILKTYTTVTLLLFAFTFSTNAQSYCTPNNFTGNKNKFFYISKVVLEDINNLSNNSENEYTYYDSNLPLKFTQLESDKEYAASITYIADQWNNASVRVWIDFNGDASFSENEEIYSFEGSNTTGTTNKKDFTFTVPANAQIGVTRMRVLTKQGALVSYSNNPTPACTVGNQRGEVEDYDVEIKAKNTAPSIDCIDDFTISLDVLGNASLDPKYIGSATYDDNDDFDDLLFSLNKSTFNCDDIGNTYEIILTVTDSEGLESTCETMVTVSNYSGNFETPGIESVSTYCEYTAPTPVMNYLCGEEITATTSDATYFNTVGTHTIDWVFTRENNSVISKQTITINAITTPQNLSVSNITDNKAFVTWDSNNAPSYKIQYKNDAASVWIETTTTTNSINLTNLDNGSDYTVKVAIDANCAAYTASAEFTTLLIDYCDPSGSMSNNNSYYISHTEIGTIDNTSNSSANEYTYYSTSSTTVTAGGTISGTITYRRNNAYTILMGWIDYNNDGDFDDAGEEIFRFDKGSTGESEVTATFTDIAIPATATQGKTRLRIGLKQSSSPPSSSCDFNNQKGEAEDYDIFINPRDTSSFQAAMFTQIYQESTDERWIEISNSSTQKIDANTLVVALFKNVNGDLTGIEPSATYNIPNEISAGNSIVIKSSSSNLNNYQTTPLTNNTITDFGDSNDVMIITTATDNTAWVHRFDVVTNFTDNTSYVRIDEINTYNTDYDTTEWVAFVDDNLATYKHPHAPLLSEVTNAAANTNTQLGIHNFGITSRTGSAWSNGTPDRSRAISINENLEQSASLAARKLTISSGQKLTIKNNLLLITDKVTINSGALIKLADSAQLIQTHTGQKNISGIGKLHIDQKSQVASKYLFNYLSSPVNTTGNSNYTVASVLRDGTEPTSTTSTPKTIEFIDGYDGKKGTNTTPISIAEYWIYTYTKGDGGRSDWTTKGSTGIIGQIDGFTLKGPGVAQNYTFVGTPKDGKLTDSIGGSQSYLVGNPYPSAINATKFIEDNTNTLDGTLYFWEHAGVEDETTDVISGHNYKGYIGGYSVRNSAMGLAANNVSTNDNENPSTPSLGNGSYKEPKEYIAVGQGFFVSSDPDGGLITFNNSQREFVQLGTNSIFFKGKKKAKKASTNSELPIIKLGMDYKSEEGTNMHRQIGISFDEKNSFARDNGFDSEIYDLGETDIYWQFPNDENKYIIAGVQEISDNLEVPLVLEMGYTGDITIAIDEWQKIDRDVFLKDKLTNQTHKISQSKTTICLEQGHYEDRFLLAFKSGNLLSNNSYNSDHLQIYHSSKDEKIIINNIQNKPLEAINLYNIVGVLVKTWNKLEGNSQETLNVSNLDKGIYIITIKTEGKTFTKKIFIK